MLANHLGKLAFGLAVMVAFTTFELRAVSAQSNRIKSTAERRESGGFWANQRASRNIRHARDYARGLGQYTTEAKSVSPAVAKSESEALGSRLEAVQKEMAMVRNENAGAPQVLEQIKGIEAKLNQVIESQAALHAECCKDTINGQACGDLAAKVSATLDEVAKDHGKLMRSMGHAPEKAAKADK